MPTSNGTGLFSDWTRKLAGFALLVWAAAILTGKSGSVSLTELATSAAIIIAVSAGKSIGTDWVKGHNGNGGAT